MRMMENTCTMQSEYKSTHFCGTGTIVYSTTSWASTLWLRPSRVNSYQLLGYMLPKLSSQRIFKLKMMIILIIITSNVWTKLFVLKICISLWFDLQTNSYYCWLNGNLNSFLVWLATCEISDLFGFTFFLSGVDFSDSSKPFVIPPETFDIRIPNCSFFTDTKQSSSSAALGETSQTCGLSVYASTTSVRDKKQASLLANIWAMDLVNNAVGFVNRLVDFFCKGQRTATEYWIV